MSGKEKLFAALCGVDEELLERSERGAGSPVRWLGWGMACLLYTSPRPRDRSRYPMPWSA